LRTKGIPIFLVEQNVTADPKIADQVYVIEMGKIDSQVDYRFAILE
jgi:ABC-type branched-subunit amino acid transport system ATPase component